jgi:hypothetical protein
MKKLLAELRALKTSSQGEFPIINKRTETPESRAKTA